MIKIKMVLGWEYTDEISSNNTIWDATLKSYHNYRRKRMIRRKKMQEDSVDTKVREYKLS